MAALLIGEKCRHCPRVIPNSIKHQCGTDAAGYTCLVCQAKERDDLDRLGRELTENCTKEVIFPGSPDACVICGSSASDYQLLVSIDGRQGFICGSKVPMQTACERKWAEGHRQKIGPQAQFELKLK